MVRPEARRGAGSKSPLPVERFFQFSLLGLVASGYLAVAGSSYLDLATVLLAGAGILLRALMLAGVLRLSLSERAASFAALAYSAFFLADYFLLSQDFLAATVHLVFFLAVLKLLTAHSHRDNFYIAVIAFLELLTAAILSININFFLCLALFLLFAIAALTSGEIRRSMQKTAVVSRGGLKYFHSRLALLGAWIALGILGLTGCMFFLLPRTADAALSRFIPHRVRIPGFSDRVTLGEIGEFQNSSRTVMHVEVMDNLPLGSAKWRGGVLIDFDGRTWSNQERRARMPRVRAVEGGRAELAPVDYTRPQRSYRVEMTDVDSRVLFFAGVPEQVKGLPGNSILESEGGAYRLRHIPPAPFRYLVLAYLDPPPEATPVLTPPPILELAQREQYLELPPDTDRRIAELARRMTVGAGTELARTRSLEQALRREYSYSLEPPKFEPADPLAHFLFARRKGHCEYFASSMAVMLRTLGIPSRMVTGFQSGVYNSISEMWLIRASDAHTWVEAWIPGRGWTTFDPTPADLTAQRFSLFSRVSLYLDAAETFWQQWVVGYDLGHQGTLAERIERTARKMGIGWFDSLSGSPSRWLESARFWLKRYGMMILVAGILVFWGRFGIPRLYRAFSVRLRVQRVRRGEASVADATLLYERMLQVLKRHGYQKPAWFTPAEFAQSIPDASLGRPVQDFTATYNAIRFGGQTGAAPRLTVLLDELERAGKQA